MPAFLAPMLIGAALGAGKGLEGRLAAKAERKRQAAVAKYSPWTGLTPHSVSSPSLMGNVATGAASGALMGGMMGGADAAAGDAALQQSASGATTPLASAATKNMSAGVADSVVPGMQASAAGNETALASGATKFGGASIDPSQGAGNEILDGATQGATSGAPSPFGSQQPTLGNFTFAKNNQFKNPLQNIFNMYK